MFGLGAPPLSHHAYGNSTPKRGKSRQQTASTILGGFQLRKRPIMGPQMLQNRSKNGVESWVWFDSAAIDPTAGVLTLAYAFRLHLNYVLLIIKGSSQELRPLPRPLIYF